MATWTVLGGGDGGGGGGSTTPGYAPVIEVPTHPGPSYIPGAPEGAPGSEEVPSQVSPEGKGAGPTSQPGHGTTTWTVVNPAAEPSIAPPTGGLPGQAGGPQQPTTEAPVAGTVPAPSAFPKPSTQPPELQQPQQTPQLPLPGGPSSVPAQPITPELQPSGAPQQPPGAGPGWSHTAKLLAAKALEGVPMAAAGILDLPQSIGTGIYNYMTAQPRVPGQAVQPAGGYQVAPELTAQQYADALKGNIASDQPFFGRMVEKGYRALGLPEPESTGEQYGADIASALGGTAATLGAGSLLGLAGRAPGLTRMLTAAPKRQLAAAAGAATAGDLTQQAGGGDLSQFLASTAGALATHGAITGAMGAGRAVRAGAQATRQPQRVAAGMLAQGTGTPGTLAQRLARAPPGVRSAPITTAQLARDPALLKQEYALEQTPAGHAIVATKAARAAHIAGVLRGMDTPMSAMTAEQRGQIIRQGLEGHEAAMGNVTDRLYNRARSVRGTYSIAGMDRRLADISRHYYGPGSGGAPSVLETINRDIVQDMRRRGGMVSNEWLINADRRIGDAAREAGRQGNNTLAAALRESQQALSAIHGSPELQAAKRWRAAVGRALGRDATGAHATGEILRTDKFGAPMVTDDRVATRAVANPGSVRQILDAGNQALAAARAAGASGVEILRIQAQRARVITAMRQQFLESAWQKAAGQDVLVGGAPQPTLTPDRWRRFWASNEQTARQLFAPGHLQDLHDITASLRDDAAARATAMSRGSPTVQHAAHLTAETPTVGHVLMGMTNGAVQPGSPAARVLEHLIESGPFVLLGHHFGGVIGAGIAHQMGHKLWSGLIGRADDMSRAALADAFADPAVARALLRQGGGSAVTQALQLSQQHNGALWRLFRDAAARAGIKAGTVTETMGNEPALGPQ